MDFSEQFYSTSVLQPEGGDITVTQLTLSLDVLAEYVVLLFINYDIKSISLFSLNVIVHLRKWLQNHVEIDHVSMCGPISFEFQCSHVAMCCHVGARNLSLSKD